MCAWIGKQGRFVDRDPLGFMNLQPHPLPSSLHSFDQQLRKQRATANNYFHPLTTKQEEPATIPEVIQGCKFKNPESEPNPPQQQCNSHTVVESPRIRPPSWRPFQFKVAVFEQIVPLCDSHTYLSLYW